MSNINGKVYALNAITPMRPWKTLVLKGFFFILGHVKPLQQDLINLSFIELPHWECLPSGLSIRASLQRSGTVRKILW